MATERLQKYLAFYRQTLEEEPDNVEARLRLAALFCEMGRRADAVRAYTRSAQDLMEQGLAMEAIAACKAILALEPGHQETHLLLARLYARVPEATDEAARIARPLESAVAREMDYGGSGVDREVTRVQGAHETGALRVASAKVAHEPTTPLLEGSPLFGELPPPVRRAVAEQLEKQRYAAHQRVVGPGEARARLCLMVSGEVRVETRRLDGEVVELARMGRGEVFGEFRLLTGQGGWAEVVASTDVVLWSMGDEEVYELGRAYPEFWQALWAFYYQRMLNNTLGTNPIFQGLSTEERELVTEQFRLREIRAGQPIGGEERGGDRLRVVVSGSVTAEDRVTQSVYGEWGPGTLLGVHECVEGAAGGHRYRGRTDVVLYEMPGNVFREMIQGLPDVALGVRQWLSEGAKGQPGREPVRDWL